MFACATFKAQGPLFAAERTGTGRSGERWVQGDRDQSSTNGLCSLNKGVRGVRERHLATNAVSTLYNQKGGRRVVIEKSSYWYSTLYVCVHACTHVCVHTYVQDMPAVDARGSNFKYRSIITPFNTGSFTGLELNKQAKRGVCLFLPPQYRDTCTCHQAWLLSMGSGNQTQVPVLTNLVLYWPNCFPIPPVIHLYISIA